MICCVITKRRHCVSTNLITHILQNNNSTNYIIISLLVVWQLVWEWNVKEAAKKTGNCLTDTFHS